MSLSPVDTVSYLDSVKVCTTMLSHFMDNFREWRDFLRFNLPYTSFTRARLPGLAQFGSTWLDKNSRVNGQKTKLFQTELAGKNNQATRLSTVRFGLFNAV